MSEEPVPVGNCVKCKNPVYMYVDGKNLLELHSSPRHLEANTVHAMDKDHYAQTIEGAVMRTQLANAKKEEAEKTKAHEALQEEQFNNVINVDFKNKRRKEEGEE